MVEGNRRTALVLASGAMRGAYQCGVLKAFREFDLEFDVVVASSAGAYNGVRYLAHQMDVCESIYVEDCSGTKLIKPWNLFLPHRHFLDLDYLVDQVCRADCKPIDMEKVLNSKSEFHIAALEEDTMITRFFDAKKEDIHLLLKATAAIPLLYSNKVMIHGKRYVDGALLEPVPVAKAVELGCKALWVILNTSKEENRVAPIRWVSSRIPGRMFRAMARHDKTKTEADRFLYQTHEELSLTIIRPDPSVRMGRFETSGEKLQSLIDIGYRDGMKTIAGGKVPNFIH